MLTLSVSTLCLIISVMKPILFTGEARNKKNEIVYREKHKEIYDKKGIKQTHTEYFSAAGDKIADLVSTYDHSPALPNYQFQDLRDGYTDGARIEDGQVVVERKTGFDKETKQKILRLKDDMVLGQGFHQSMRLKLNDIDQGQVLHVQLVLPTRLNDYSFRVRKIKREADTLTLRLEIDNWFLRLFAPYIEVAYDMKTRNLVFYKGPSNVFDSDGDVQNVSITYQPSR